MIDYIGNLSKSWQIIIKHKFLWLFGFFIALSGGGSTNFNFSFPSDESTSNVFRDIAGRASQVDIAVIAAIIILLLAIGLIILILGYISQGALIGSVDDIVRREDASLEKGLKKGWKYWLYILLISLLLAFIIFIFILAIFIIIAILLTLLLGPGLLALFLKKTVLAVILFVIGGFFSIAVFIAAIASAIAFSALITLIRIYSYRFLVIKQQGVIDSIRKSIELFKKRTKDSIIVWFANFAIGLVTGIASILILVIFALPVIIAAFINIYLAIVIAIPALLIYVFLLGIVQSYIQTYLTLLFIDITAEEPAAEAAAVVSS